MPESGLDCFNCAMEIRDLSNKLRISSSASTAPCTSSRMCCPAHCASYCALCQALLRSFSGWIRSPPPAVVLYSLESGRGTDLFDDLARVVDEHRAVDYPVAHHAHLQQALWFRLSVGVAAQMEKGLHETSDYSPRTLLSRIGPSIAP
jgi:hypothetical protein